MKTKLVYVLTCAPEKHYIEQALISVFSARYWNPDAHIVLIVDDMTDHLLVDERSELLQYISEKIVVPFDDSELSPVYRSRWIKTSVRQFVNGRYLFIDCDTIVVCSLEMVDQMEIEVGAVPDSLIPVKDYCKGMYNPVEDRATIVGYDLTKEEYYYNSGVMLIGEREQSYNLYNLWHSYWLKFAEKGLLADQPTLARANIEMNHLISPMDLRYNCIVYTQNSFTREAKILHISSYRNPSFIFSDKVLRYVRENGLNNEWLVATILNPCSTFLPFDYDVLNSNSKQRKKWKKEIALSSKGYGQYIDSSFEDFPMQSRFRWIVVALLRNKCYRLGAGVWMFWKRTNVLRKRDIKDNVCRK